MIPFGGKGLMRKLILASLALLALASPAMAADLGPPANEGHISNWTGCHVGGNAGGLWGHQHWINQTQGGDFFGYSLGEHDQGSWIAGVQAGCDYQTSSGFVVGVAGDYGWTDAEGSHASARETGVFYHSEADSLASVTGRIGYGWDRVLGYSAARFFFEKIPWPLREQGTIEHHEAGRYSGVK
jgi:outer membrane immunogenic protein